VEYVSSIYPDIFKLVDAGISGAHFRFELGEDVKTAVVSRGGITEVPDFLVETIRETIESYTYIQDLDEEALIEYANPASGFCNYCSNDLCDRNRAIRNRQPALA
jgi:hypothetical protein